MCTCTDRLFAFRTPFSHCSKNTPQYQEAGGRQLSRIRACGCETDGKHSGCDELRAGCVLPLAVATSASALFSPGGLDLPLPEHSARPRATGAVLIWGGSSSVGCAGIQLAVAAGCEVYATCSKRNFGLVKALGVKKVLDYRSPSVVGDVVGKSCWRIA